MLEFALIVVEISGRGRHDYESDSTECWLSIPFSAALKNGLKVETL